MRLALQWPHGPAATAGVPPVFCRGFCLQRCALRSLESHHAREPCARSTQSAEVSNISKARQSLVVEHWLEGGLVDRDPARSGRRTSAPSLAAALRRSSFATAMHPQLCFARALGESEGEAAHLGAFLGSLAQGFDAVLGPRVARVIGGGGVPMPRRRHADAPSEPFRCVLRSGYDAAARARNHTHAKGVPEEDPPVSTSSGGWG
jgi:hypothetical protein